MSLPYERGSLLPDTAADMAKLRAAWRIVERRHGEGTLFNFTGLERSLDLGGADTAVLDDDLAPALFGERLTAPPPAGIAEIHSFEIYGSVMVIFFLISFPLTRLAAYLERRLV